jgi:hypothetical protein
VFWVGNFCAPWLVLAFAAGHLQRGWAAAAAAGVMTELACVAGFYERFLVLPRESFGLPRTAPSATYVRTSLVHWLHFIAPWSAAALAAGLVYGLLGFAWRRFGGRAVGLALALPFLAEPGLWPLRNGYYQGPWTLWASEVAIGIGVAVVMTHQAAQRRPRALPPR